MSVYVGIDVDRKRSQLAVINAEGGVLANRNVPNGAEPILKVIGDLPAGTPAAFEAPQTAKRSPEFAAGYQGTARRRGKKIATPAVARKLLTRAWHLLTDAGPAVPQPATAPETPRRLQDEGVASAGRARRAT